MRSLTMTAAHYVYTSRTVAVVSCSRREVRSLSAAVCRYRVMRYEGLPSLSLQYHGLAGSATPLNMTNHSYFNLAGHVSRPSADSGRRDLIPDRPAELAQPLTGSGAAAAPSDRSPSELPESLTADREAVIGDAEDPGRCGRGRWSLW